VRVLVVSGIWPPDVGGPASHAPEVAEFLRGRGHEVEVVTTADSEPGPEPYAVHWVQRATPLGVRHAAAAALIARRAREADVVYATSMLGRAGLGTAVGRAPLVVKLTTDPAFERARRRGLVRGSIEDFQRAGGLAISALRRARDLTLGRASYIVCPSAYLRELALGWGLPPERVGVLPNPVQVPTLPPREELRAKHGLEGPTLVTAGRLVAQKALEVALAAVELVPEARLLVVGDGEEREQLEARAGERVSFLGARPRSEVFELYRAADLAVLSSRWENFPHALVEALAVGTPVVATAVGGVPEIVDDGQNGLLVPPDDAEELAAAIRIGLAGRERLATVAAASVERFAPERIYGELLAILEAAAS
jgi:glycosyltransferase involved in cell wall biosynthesis